MGKQELIPNDDTELRRSIDSHKFDYEFLFGISSTSLPGGNQVDGLPPASSEKNRIFSEFRFEHTIMTGNDQGSSWEVLLTWCEALFQYFQDSGMAG